MVFVSSDHSEGEFEGYFAEHKWRLAVPFSATSVRGKLGQKFRVQGIPTLVVVDGQGATVTTEAVQSVMSDPTAAEFPWKPKTFWEAMEGCSGPLIDKSGGSTPVSDLKSKDVIGLYFSAHWCPPCR